MTNINPKIAEIFHKYHIDHSDGMLYLLSVYHELKDNGRVPDEVIKQVNLSKIMERDYELKGNVIWHIPLYEKGDITNTEWDWIEEWRQLFGNFRSDAIGNKKSCYIKMKKYFAEHPSVRKDDIINATNMYLHKFIGRSAQQLKFLQQADYFISKQVKSEGGIEYNSRLDMYLEVLKGTATEGQSRQMNNIVT